MTRSSHRTRRAPPPYRVRVAPQPIVIDEHDEAVAGAQILEIMFPGETVETPAGRMSILICRRRQDPGRRHHDPGRAIMLDANSQVQRIDPLAFPFALPRLVVYAGTQAQRRYLEFFAATIRNAHTRRAYARASVEFLGWCELQGVPQLAAVQPLHVATWIELVSRRASAPTAKQKLAAIRHLFDWLVTGQVIATNSAASVRGPSHNVRRGKTPVFDPKEARRLLDAIDVTTPVGLRDRADDLFVRADRRGAGNARRGSVHPARALVGAAA